jgi:hypothetical protein
MKIVINALGNSEFDYLINFVTLIFTCGLLNFPSTSKTQYIEYLTQTLTFISTSQGLNSKHLLFFKGIEGGSWPLPALPSLCPCQEEYLTQTLTFISTSQGLNSKHLLFFKGIEGGSWPLPALPSLRPCQEVFQ